MHRILAIRTIQGDQNVRRLHGDADLKMAGERKKKQFHGTGLFHVRTVPSDPRPYKCSLQHPRPKQPNQFLVVLDSPTIESTKKRPKTKILERSLPRAPSTPPRRRSKSHAPAADSRELLLQLVQATNLLQLLGSQEEPIRDALELVRVVDLLATSPRSPATHAQKGGKKYHLLRSVVD